MPDETNPTPCGVRYLRVSVTDRCNLRCSYCRPRDAPDRERRQLLTFDEIERVVASLARRGVSHVRATGGEPLVRAGLPALLARLHALPGVEDLSITTNGTLFSRHAEELLASGVRRVNFSLDSLRHERFRDITGSADMATVFAAVERALALGFSPVKINTVVIGRLNDDELVEMARRTIDLPVSWRFIELMSFKNDLAGYEGVPVAKMRRTLEEACGVVPLPPGQSPEGAGPAEYFRIPGAAGTIGLIPTVSGHLCARCNRLRLTADGRIKLCLLRPAEIDLLPALRGDDPEALERMIDGAFLQKGTAALAEFSNTRHMFEIGG